MSITLEKVIISFPSLFKPKQFMNRAGKPEGDPRYEAQFLIPPTHPQYEAVQIEKQNAITASTIFDDEIPEDCNDAVVFYADAFSKSKNYDPALDDWIVVKGSAKEDGRPAVVDMSRQEVLDPGACFPGQLVNANVNIACYAGGKGGLGAFLNGVMLTDETGELGRLDSKPTVDQMFGSVSDAPAKKSMAKPSDKAGKPAPKPPSKAAPKPPSKPKHVMTDEAENTYEEYIEAGWTDVDLIDAGLMEGPSTSF